MRTSETQDALVKALHAARCEFPKIGKTKTGQVGKRPFKYAPLESILDAVNPALQKHGLLVTQAPSGYSIVTRIDHVSGQWRESDMPLNTTHGSNQDFGVEITYRRRYALQMALGIITEDDIDAPRARGQKQASDAPTDPEIDDKRLDQLRELAMYIIDSHGQGRDIDAIQAWYSPDSWSASHEDRMAEQVEVWGMLRDYSALRATIKANRPKDATT